MYATGEANQQTVAHQSSLPDAPRLISTIRVQAAHERQARLLPLAQPATISARPGIQRPGAVIATPQIARGSPVKNNGFRNAFSIATTPLRNYLIKPQSLPVDGGRGARMFICAETKIGRCKSLGDQVRVLALRLGGGWSQAREDLAKEAEQWFGREPVTTKQEWRAVRAEVFRTE